MSYTNNVASTITVQNVPVQAQFDASGNCLGLVGPAGVFFSPPLTSDTITGATIDNSVIGGTTPAAGSFTSLAYSTTLTGGTGIVNLGSGQIYKDASGNLGIGTSSFALPNAGRGLLEINGTTDSIIGFKYANNTVGYIQANSATFNINSASTQPLYFTAGGTTQPVVFQTNSTERMRIDSSGNVGVGTSSPGVKLDVQGTTIDARVYSSNAGGKARMFVRGDTANMSYESDGTAQTSLLFDNVAGQPAYTYGLGASGYWRFFTAGSERMRIDSSGNVGIGVAPSNAYASGKVIQVGVVGGATLYGSSTTTTLGVNINIDSTGAFTYATTAAANYYSQAIGIHRWYNAASGTAGTSISFTQAMMLDATGGLSLGTTTNAGAGNFLLTGNVVQGTAAKGFNFTANTPAAGMTSQLLNWYEEGTYTPTDISGASLSFTVDHAKYTRIGRLVTASVYLTYPTTASVLTAKISLPFTSANYDVGSANSNSASSATAVITIGGAASCTVRNSTSVSLTNANLSGSQIIFTISYPV